MIKRLLFLSFATVILSLNAPLTLMADEITTKEFGTLPSGEKAQLFILKNTEGLTVTLSDFGALLLSVDAPDRDGKFDNVTLSYQNAEEAFKGGAFGNIIGRFANRIDTGGFTIDGKRYDLETVNPKTNVHIHGGKTGFQRQLWTAEVLNKNSVSFSISSPDGHEGFPGKIDASVTYTLTENNDLQIDYQGTTDKPTHLNLTNHVYFNLAGSGDVLEHELQLQCEKVLAVDDRKIPTGIRLPVADTAFDFLKTKKVGQDIGTISGGGYDHCFVISEEKGEPKLRPVAVLTDPQSGRKLEVSTTKPGVQIFTANHFKGKPFPQWGGICFETQYYPDSPNKPDFPTSLLRPGETYQHTTIFRFSVLETDQTGSNR